MLEHLKGDATLRHVPVIMISAVDQVESVVRCITLGAEDYLPKPFNPTLLRARIGATLEKKRLRDEIVAARDRLARELMAARDVQLAMVPSEFPPPSAERPVEIWASLQPALEVGGDLYDFFWRDSRTLCFVVADVSDKGAPAALFMARTRTVIRLVVTLAGGPGAAPPDLPEIVRLVNAELCAGNRDTTFVTLVIGMLDVDTGTVRFCNAGHPRPFVLGPHDAIARLDGGAAQLPVGVHEGVRHRVSEWTLGPGATIFLYTDGMTDAADASGTLFGEARLEAALRGVAGASAEATVSTAVDAVRKFAGATPQADDIAVVAIRFRASDRP